MTTHYELDGGVVVVFGTHNLSLPDEEYLYNTRADAQWAAHVMATLLPLSNYVLTCEKPFQSENWMVAVYKKEGERRKYQGPAATIRYQTALQQFVEKENIHVVPDSNSADGQQQVRSTED